MKKNFGRVLIVLLTVVLCAALFTACDKSGGGNEPAASMTESYQRARSEFLAVTGIELPALDGLIIEEAFPYRAGATDYELDITAGDNLTRETFQTFVTFLDAALASWTKT